MLLNHHSPRALKIVARIVCLCLAFGMLVACASPQPASEPTRSAAASSDTAIVEIIMEGVVPVDNEGLAIANEVLLFGGDDCDRFVKEHGLTLVADMSQSEGIAEQSSFRYQIHDKTPIDTIVNNVNDARNKCRGFPNLIIFASGTNSSFGSPFNSNPQNVADPNILRTQDAIQVLQDNFQFTGRGVTVAVFDTVLCEASLNHLQAHGFGDVTLRRSYVVQIDTQSNNENQDQCSHAEAVIGLIKTIAPDANIVLFPVLGANGFGALSGLIQALDDSLPGRSGNGIVINTSLGIGGNISYLDNRLFEQFNVSATTIAASGNFRNVPNAPVPSTATQFPAAFSSTIATEGSNTQGTLAAYSNPGIIRAPGGDGDCGSQSHDCIAVLNSRSSTGAMWGKGTSYSTAIVTGLVARILEQKGQLGSTQVSNILDCGTSQNGLINIAKTLNAC